MRKGGVDLIVEVWPIHLSRGDKFADAVDPEATAVELINQRRGR